MREAASEAEPVVRRADREDLGAIVALEEGSFASPWTASMIARDLRTRAQTPYWVVETGGEVVAYLAGWLSWPDFHVASIATSPAWRRRGLAELLLLTALRFAARQGAECARLEYRVSNQAAAGLYTKLGFTRIRRRAGYYADTGEDAWEMALEGLSDPQVQAHLRQLEEAWRQRHGAHGRDAEPEA